MLTRATTELLVFAAVADGPRHGYAIKKRIQQATGRTIAYGTLYPLLKRLESEGFLFPQQDDNPRKRTWYRLTPEGQTHFKHLASTWQATIARLQGLVLPALRHAKNHPTK